MRIAAAALALLLAPLGAQDQPAYTFGTTVVNSAGFRGRIFRLRPGTDRLPRFKRLKLLGEIYTTALNVEPRHFEEGFPNVAKRVEWFAIEYTGKLWIENPGYYQFSLLSDDGSRLKLNEQVVIDHDGLHAATRAEGGAALSRGVHEIKVEYFQGPGTAVALVLSVEPPGEAWRVLNLEDFKPPADQQDWLKGTVSAIGRGRDR